MVSQQKLGAFLLKKVFLEIIEIENVANESCSPNLIFILENHFQEVSVDF